MANISDAIIYLITGGVIGFIAYNIFKFFMNLKINSNIPKNIYHDHKNAKEIEEELKKPQYNLPFINKKIKISDWINQNKKKSIIFFILIILICLNIIF